MRGGLRGVSFWVLSCFLFNIIVPDAVFSQNVFVEPEYKLAAQSIFSGLADMEFRETENLKLVIKAHLLEIAGGSENIKIKDLIRYAQNHYNNSIFDKTHVYFSEEQKLPKGLKLSEGYHFLKCRIKDENDMTRTYYAVFSLNKDSEKGFNIEVVTDREWDDLKKLTKPLTTLPQRASEKPEDAETQRRYSELNEGVIDKFIREHIGTKEHPGRFTEFSGRAKKLGWNTKYPNRARPALYYEAINGQFDNFLWVKIEQQLRRINTAFQFETAFKNKNIVLIPLEKNENLPIIKEKDPITGKIRKVSLSSHSSKNAVYFFIKQEFLNKIMMENNAWNDSEIISFFRKCIVHEMGESFGLPIVQITENGRVLNDLDILYEAILDGSFVTTKDETFKTKVKNLKKLTQNDIVNLDHLRWKSPITGEDVERDYAAGKFKEIDAETWEILQNVSNIADIEALELFFDCVVYETKILSMTLPLSHDVSLLFKIFGDSTSLYSIRQALKTEYGKRLVAFKKAELDAWEKEVQDEKDSRILQNFKNISDLKTLDVVFDYVINKENFYGFTDNHVEEDRLFSEAFGDETAIDPVRNALKTEYGKRLVAFKKAELDTMKKDDGKEKVFSEAYLNFRKVEFIESVENVLSIMDSKEDVNISANKDVFKNVFGTTNLSDIRNALGTEEGKLLVEAYRFEIEQHNALLSELKLRGICEKFRKLDNYLILLDEAINIVDSKLKEVESEENKDILKRAFGTESLAEIRDALGSSIGEKLLDVKRMELKIHDEEQSEKRQQVLLLGFRNIEDMEVLAKILKGIDSDEKTFMEPELRELFVRYLNTGTFDVMKESLNTEQGRLLKKVKQMELEIWQRREFQPEFLTGVFKKVQALDSVEDLEKLKFLTEAIDKKPNEFKKSDFDMRRVRELCGTESASQALTVLKTEAISFLVRAKLKESEIAAREGSAFENVVTEEKLLRDQQMMNARRVKRYEKIANEIGIEIAPPNCRYTLFTFNDMYVGDEFKADESAFASRFRLLKIGTGKTKELSRSILGRMTKLGLDPKNVIVQLPSSMVDAAILVKIKEKAQGIKFMIVDMQGLKGIDDKAVRREYRENIYSMMYLARNIDRGTRKTSELYRLLRYYVKEHFPIVEDRDREIDKYMRVVMENNLEQIINLALSYKPVEKLSEPDVKLVSAVFMSA